MCTVGVLFTPEDGVVTFKQCDLPYRARFFPPRVEDGVLPFTRDGAPGPYAGCNDHGVMLVGADAYVSEGEADQEALASVDTMAAYAHVLQHAQNAGEAASILTEFYEEQNALDIALLADGDEAWLLESSPRGGVAHARLDEGWLVATNHFRLLPGAVEWRDNQSTYLRLDRGEEILRDDPSLDGVAALLLDQAFGRTERSICRVARRRGEYSTQASVVMRARPGGGMDCVSLRGGNPRTRRAQVWHNVFDGDGPSRTPVRLWDLDDALGGAVR